ncbi:MAG: ArnT family glycosyltransferase, partial [Polyangiaceae bacterium]
MALARFATARLELARAARSPLGWILGAVLVLHLVGAWWGLPASDGWDVDGVAPRDVLAGLVETVTPGQFYVYPPVHLLLVGVLTAPVTVVALIRAPSLAPADVVREVIQVPYMTLIAGLARLVSVAMSLGIVWAVAKMTEEVRGKRAGWCAAAIVGVNVPLTYYAHTSNLDVPYVFWACLALLSLVRAVARREPRRLRAWGLLAALSIGTKDQAYALYLVAVPAGVALWLALDGWARASVRTIARELGFAIGIAAAVLLVADGVIFNPSGFHARVRFLLGPASQSYAEYTDDWAGRWHVVADLVSRFWLFYPVVFALAFALGLVVLLRVSRSDGPRLAAGLLPLLACASFTIAFNCAARRTDQRFELPQSILLAVYGGVGLYALVFQLRAAPARLAARAVAAASFAVALFAAADVDANLVLDPRYDAEAWLRARVAPGDAIETYGQNVYMPRFPAPARVTRVGPDAQDHRNPMPAVEEVLAPYDAAQARGARFIVVSEGWVWRYLMDPGEALPPGRMLAPTQRETSTDAATTAYFHALTAGRYGSYRLA